MIKSKNMIAKIQSVACWQSGWTAFVSVLETLSERFSGIHIPGSSLGTMVHALRLPAHTLHEHYAVPLVACPMI